MKTSIKQLLLLPTIAVCLELMFVGGITAQTFTTLHNFTNGNDGANPDAGLISSGKTLYGTATQGGVSGNGTVFAINANGKDFTNLYDFASDSDGASPNADLLLSGNTLYGTTLEGGANGSGIVFKVNAEGSDFTNLYDFTATDDNGLNSDGSGPQAGLIISGGMLYGTAYSGGSGGWGTVFAINTNGMGFTNLHSFVGTDGADLVAELVLSGNTLYGTAQSGGSSGSGTVFKIGTNGADFTNVYAFTATSGVYPNQVNNDGAFPSGVLILSGNTLYGVATAGGSSANGTIFAVNTDGSGFTNLYTFTASQANSSGSYTNSDGANPGGLILLGNTLYGTASRGGVSGNGTVFAVNSDGTGFTNLYSFRAMDHNGFNSDGAFPNWGLTLLGNTIYGTAYQGGHYGQGTVFSISLEPTSPQQGSLQVTITPSNVVTAGAQWRVDGGAFHNSGAVVTGLSIGSHNVSFKAVAGWITPASQNIAITAAATNALTGLYLDATKPSLSISLPTNGMNVTTANYTVVGTAHDNVAVSSVFYSFNHSTPTAASTTNNWTNWAAALTLLPGTNTLQVYAVDTSNNNSTNHNVTFFYELKTPLAVNLYGGKGTVSIANGALLDIGKSYSITATASAGFKFTGWTGSTNATNATIHFIMSSSLAFTADFLDSTKPTLSISTPANGVTVTNANLAMVGTARDNVGVANVFYELDGGVPQIPTTSNNWTNWNIVLALTPGTNRITAWSSDAAGNNSTNHNLSLFYQVKVPLSVSKVGQGTLSTNYNNVLLAIGRNYSITATAAAGFKFAGWSGSTNITNATLHFMMESNLAYTANFQDNTLPTVSITSPTNGQVVTNFNLAITGKAGDNVAVTNVYFTTTGGTIWTSANTANNWTNWNALASLALGSNVIQAYSEDSTGLESTKKSVTVIRQPLRTTFPIANGGMSKPQAQLAFDGTNYLVALQTQSLGLNDTAVLFVSQSGAVIDPGLTHLLPLGGSDPPAVAFDGSNYLVAAAMSGQAGNYVQGAFVAPNNSGGPAKQLTQSVTVDNFYTLVYGGGVYFLMWSDSVNSANNGGFDDIYGAMINPDGSMASGDFEIGLLGQQTEAGEGSAAFDGTNFLATWGGATGGTSINGRLISPTGYVTDPFVIYTNHAVLATKSINCAVFDGTKYLVLFNTQVGSGSPTNWHLAGRFVTTAGEVLTNQITITSDAGPQIVPCAAFDGTDYLITWNQGFNPFTTGTTGTTRARFFDINGHPIAPEFTLFTPTSGQTALWAPVLFDGTQFFSVGEFGHQLSASPNLKFTNGIISGAFISQ